jgi:hypothetical protein
LFLVVSRQGKRIHICQQQQQRNNILIFRLPTAARPTTARGAARRRKFWDRPAFGRNFAISAARSWAFSKKDSSSSLWAFSLFRGRVEI